MRVLIEWTILTHYVYNILLKYIYIHFGANVYTVWMTCCWLLNDRDGTETKPPLEVNVMYSDREPWNFLTDDDDDDGGSF